MQTIVSPTGHAETLARLLDAITRRGMTVFARIDHAAAARQLGMELADEVVVLFGNPRTGTPLMQTDPRIGIELPLRVLLWHRDDATVLGYHDPRSLAARYDVGSQERVLDAMSSLLDEIAHEVTARAMPD